MAIKKSELYSSLWESCDQLRGSMDASQYKDYVLVLLFMKYVSDKKDPVVELKEGTTFYDMLQHRGKSDIGDQINKIIGEFAKNNNLSGIIDQADFNDETKLGRGKDKVDRLTNLLNIFNKPELNFSNNYAEDDDLLGDAYEYLMQHFAVESGKSKGQFYTPAEVSRVMAELIGIRNAKSPSQTLYDPTCGSGSLLLKAANLAPHGITIYGQENDNATRALSVMNMWLHNFPDAEIKLGNTIASPQFTDDQTGELKQFDYAVANPPFSYKAWMNGLDPKNDIYKRFEGYNAIPPQKNGDFAFLLHLIKSLKSKGKACIVLPLGVLFRGNAEGEIRKQIIEKGYIKAIIGLPPNLFYGTGIAACLIVIDKEDADKRTHIFMIDASKGFKKDGNKNRLREQDIHKIVDAFNHQLEIPKYARRVPITEIADPKNDYNLNIPRYIDSQEEEDIQDIEAHLLGGIPKRDIDALEHYWNICPSLKNELFQPIENRPNYYQVKTQILTSLSATICKHPEFIAFGNQMKQIFEHWKNETHEHLKKLNKGLKPKYEIHTIAENLLKHYDPVSELSVKSSVSTDSVISGNSGVSVETRHALSLQQQQPQRQNIIDKYALYQHLLDYWNETMQDDLYEIAAEGWQIGNEVKRIQKKSKKGNTEIAGIEGLQGTLIPLTLIIKEYFAHEQKTIDEREAEAETLNTQMQELIDEHSGEEGLLNNAIDDKGKISKANLGKAIKELGKRNEENAEEYDMLAAYKKLMDEEADTQAKIKTAKAELEKKVLAKYPTLTLDEIKTLVIEKKWMAEIERHFQTEIDNISHRLTQRIKELAERYETPLPILTNEVEELKSKVEEHLKQMGYKWS